MYRRPDGDVSTRAPLVSASTVVALFAERIVVPIHNELGQLTAYIGGAIGAGEPQYRFPTGFKKSLALFNLHRAVATGARAVIIVEGFFGCFAVHQAGYPTVDALVGSTLSPRQAEFLVSISFGPYCSMATKQDGTARQSWAGC